jgi:hypothetical protein
MKSILKIRTTKTTGILQLIHSNIAKPFSIKSLEGTFYFLTFIDNFLKKTWIHFLTTTNKCFTKFWPFYKELEMNSWRKIITLWIDNKKEFTSREFNTYYINHGIRCQNSQTHTPQHNKVAERKNRTLLDIVQCFLTNWDILGQLWAKAICATCIVTSLCSSKLLLNKTLEELFLRIEPNISKSQTFGLLIYVH